MKYVFLDDLNFSIGELYAWLRSGCHTFTADYHNRGSCVHEQVVIYGAEVEDPYNTGISPICRF